MTRLFRYGLVALSGVLVLLILLFACVHVSQFLQAIAPARYLGELPREKVKPVFERLSGKNLPEETVGLRGLLEEGMDPAIVVKFETNADGITHILQTFGGERVPRHTMPAQEVTRFIEQKHSRAYTLLLYWQQQVADPFFDGDFDGLVQVLESTRHVVVIDDDAGRVYVFIEKDGRKMLKDTPPGAGHRTTTQENAE